MKWFLNRSTQTKLMTAFMTVCAMLVIVGAVGIANLEKMDHQVQSLAEKHMKGVTAILSAESNMYKTGKAMRQSILESTVEEVRAQNDVATAAMSEMETNFAECEKTLVTAEAKARMQKIHELYPRWVDAQRRAMQLALEMKNSEAVAVVQKAAVEANEMAAAAAEIRKSKIDLGDQAARDASVAYQRARALMIAIVVAGALLAVGLGVFISRLLSRPLQQAEQVLAVVAEGDFTRRLAIDTRDEVGRLATSLNKAVESMRGALSQVAHTAQEVSTASGELSSASQSISAGAQEQASSLEETAASLEEMTSAVKQNADNAQQAAQLAQGAREVAEKGGKVVGAAVSAMSEINASSRKIADIITAIDEIAFQTNLLALNAAVEAARAGEQGRGFAVVAGEVRNLAQRSATAAKEIKGLISDSVEKVESGSQLVNQSGATLDEIVQSVKRVTDIVGEIAASSREQSTGIEQVNTAVTQMDAVTQANASQTEELAGTAEGLSHQAQALMTLVQRFRLGDGGAPPAVARAVSNAPARAVAKAKVVPMRAGRRAAAKAAPVVVAPIAAATGTDGFEEF